MTKRQKFVLTSFFSSIGFLAIQLFDEKYHFLGIGFLSLFSTGLFAWSLREGLSLDMTLLSLVLPLFFTIGTGLFWFLLPSGLIAKIPILFFYGIGVYVLVLTSNIYTVSAIRTIALMRAARGVGFVFSLVTFFLISDAILSLRVNVFLTVFLAILISFPIFMQGYWTIRLKRKLSKELVVLSSISTLIVGEMAFGIFFWPATVVVGSLFLTANSYVLLGLGQSSLERRLFRQTVREYLTVGVLVFLGTYLATKWGL